MFGFVTANTALLSPGELTRYRGCYCGLCRALGERGQLCRLTLTYDFAFLALLHHALEEPPERGGEGRCLRHPLRRQAWWRSDATEYAAAMNVLFGYYKLLDDWQDDRNVGARTLAAALAPAARQAERDYPRQAEAAARELAALSSLERAGIADIDRACACFGRLMGELFVRHEGDHWAPRLRAVGDGLGRFIYTLDALIDLPEDRKRGRYNPLAELSPDEAKPDRLYPALTVLLGGAAAAFEELPIVQDVHILRSVLYSGVWARFPTEKGGEEP